MLVLLLINYTNIIKSNKTDFKKCVLSLFVLLGQLYVAFSEFLFHWQTSGILADITKLKKEIEEIQQKKNADQQKALQTITQLQVRVTLILTEDYKK